MKINQNSTPEEKKTHFSTIESGFTQKLGKFMQIVGISGQILAISAISAPFERMKLINQVRPDLKAHGYKGLETNSQIWARVRSENVFSAFKGTRIIFARNFIFHMFQNNLCNRFRSLGDWMFGKGSGLSKFFSGTLSSLFVMAFCYPLDVLKTQIQCEMGEKGKLFFKRIYWSYRHFAFG